MSKINFVEFAVLDFDLAINRLSAFGFHLNAKHKEKNIVVLEQNHNYIVLNGMATKHAMSAHNESGDSICGVGVSCREIPNATLSEDTLFYGQLYKAKDVIPFIGNCQLYLFDESSPLFTPDEWTLNTRDAINTSPSCFTGFDHIAFAIDQGKMNYWIDYVEKVLPNFECTSNINVEGNHSGMQSIAFITPSNQIRIPIVEPKNSKSQVQDFLNTLNKEGAQHIAFETDNIIKSIEKIKKNKIKFLKAPENYYESIEKRLNSAHYPKNEIIQHDILVDQIHEDKILYQIFTEKQIGPIFFELVERHNYEGFGEGNYKALFISVEEYA